MPMFLESIFVLQILTITLLHDTVQGVYWYTSCQGLTYSYILHIEFIYEILHVVIWRPLSLSELDSIIRRECVRQNMIIIKSMITHQSFAILLSMHIKIFYYFSSAVQHKWKIRYLRLFVYLN